MRGVKFLFVLFAVIFFAVLALFMYRQWVDSKNLSSEVLNSPDYTIALSQALRLRFFEALVAGLVFPIGALALAYWRFPQPSWLRSLLCGAGTLLAVWVVFSKLMESEFQARFQSAPLPMAALQTAFLFGLYGILFVGVVFFFSERIHAWRVDR